MANFKHFYRQEVKLAQMFAQNRDKNHIDEVPILIQQQKEPVLL